MNHLVIIGTVFPEPTSTAAGSRMMQLIDIFKQLGMKISFLSSAEKNQYSVALEQLHITTYSIVLNNTSFDDLIKNINPTIVLFDRFISEEQYGWRITENCPNALKIIDTEDLHFLRKAREIAFKNNRELHPTDFLNDIFKREMAAIYRCDLSLIISKYEINLLTKHFNVPASLLFYLPFITDGKKEVSTVNSFKNRQHFVSIGNFLHLPNWHTVLSLKKIWPSIKKKLPEAELHIYGAYISAKVWQLNNQKEGFLIKGRADAVENVFNTAKVLLAPIPFGAGLKGKLFDSMCFGLPNVTSSIGAEGMYYNTKWNGFICDITSNFITKSVALYTDENIWNTAQKNGFEILTTQFLASSFVSNFNQQISYLLENYTTHRNANFLGSILQHHTLQSTKFMSKWIEEKQKMQDNK